jgi:hypothetical protein
VGFLHSAIPLRLAVAQSFALSSPETANKSEFTRSLRVEWHYPELSPPLLPELMTLNLSLDNEPELSRAIWFCSRRPKGTLYESGTALVVEGLGVLLASTIALVDWPLISMSELAAEGIILAFCVAFLSH